MDFIPRIDFIDIIYLYLFHIYIWPLSVLWAELPEIKILIDWLIDNNDDADDGDGDGDTCFCVSRRS